MVRPAAKAAWVRRAVRRCKARRARAEATARWAQAPAWAVRRLGAGALEKSDPEMYKLVKADMDLERQTRELAMQYRQAPTDERAKLKAQVTELVGKHFDVRQQRRALELKRLEAELQRLREASDRRQKAREKLVGQRVDDLLGHEDEERF